MVVAASLSSLQTMRFVEPSGKLTNVAMRYLLDLTRNNDALLEGVPAGGSAGQVLSKINNNDYNTQWTSQIIRCSTNDTTPNFLLNKLSSGSNIAFALQNSSADENIQISWSAAINDLSDVVITSPLNNQVLAYIGGNWTNQTLSPIAETYATTTADITASSLKTFVDANAGAITITLPTAASVAGFTYTIKKIDSSINAVSVAASGAETIDGSATQSLPNQYDVLRVFSNGTQWFIV